MELHAGNRQNRLLVHLRVVQTVQQMNAAGAGGRQANTQASGELCVGTGHKGGGFFMPYVDETDPVLGLAERFHDAVDAIAGQPKDRIHTPCKQSFHQYV